jgi:protein ImuB
VIEAAGPWRTSGDWWTSSPWMRDEWDVELSDGALYRIYCESKTKDWYVQAVYD